MKTSCLYLPRWGGENFPGLGPSTWYWVVGKYEGGDEINSAQCNTTMTGKQNLEYETQKSITCGLFVMELRIVLSHAWSVIPVCLCCIVKSGINLLELRHHGTNRQKRFQTCICPCILLAHISLLYHTHIGQSQAIIWWSSQWWRKSHTLIWFISVQARASICSKVDW